MDWVLDCSLALAWVLPDEGAPRADRFLARLSGNTTTADRSAGHTSRCRARGAPWKRTRRCQSGSAWRMKPAVGGARSERLASDRADDLAQDLVGRRGAGGELDVEPVRAAAAARLAEARRALRDIDAAGPGVAPARWAFLLACVTSGSNRSRHRSARRRQRGRRAALVATWTRGESRRCRGCRKIS
jgi:hypothetical protein